MVEQKFLSRRWIRALVLVAWVILAFVIGQFIVVELTWVLVQIGVDFSAVNDAVLETILTAITWVVVLLLAVGVPFFVYKKKITRRDIGLQRLPTWAELGLALAGYVASAIVAYYAIIFLGTIVPGFDAVEEQDVGFVGLSHRYEYVVAFVTLVIIAPFAEEIFFRGYIYGKLKRYIPTWLAIVVVSIMFGAAHGQWNVGVMTFIMSLFMCGLRDLTGSLWPAIVLHMTRNGIAYTVLFIVPMMV